MIDFVLRYDPESPNFTAPPRDAEEARRRLEEGNRTFCHWMGDCRQAPGADLQHLMPTGAVDWIVGTYGAMPRQLPFAAVLGCSDARVPLEIIFSQGFNELFTSRVAGNVLGDAVLGSLEYAVDALSESVRAIVVLGHTGCGAVRASVQAYLEPESLWTHVDSPLLRQILQRILPAVREADLGLREVWGPSAPAAPGYLEALAESAVCLNAAHVAFTLRGELEHARALGIGVYYGVYDVRTHRVSLPVDPFAPDDPSRVNLAPAAEDPRAFLELSRQMAEILRPGRVLPDAGLASREGPAGGAGPSA